MPTIETSIWLALKARASTIPGGMPIAWPGAVFEPNATAHVVVTEIIADPDRIMVGQGAHRRAGTLQLLIKHPVGTVHEVIKEAAGLIAAHFPVDLKLNYGSVSVRVDRAAAVSETYRDEGWLNTPVRVRWDAFA